MSKLFVLCVFHKYCSSNNGSVSYFLDTFKRHFCGFPTVISLRGRQHFWICSFLVSIDWRSQHNLSKYLVDGISSALKKLSLYFKQRCVLWILGLPGKKVNFRLSLSKLQKSRYLPQNGAVQPACLTASFIFSFFFLVVVFLSCFVFVVFYWSKMCCTSFQN